MKMKWSDNEEAQKEYEKEVKEQPEKIAKEKEKIKEIFIEKIAKKEREMRKIWKEDAKLRKKDRNKRDYQIRRGENIDSLTDEIYYLELAMKTRFRNTDTYRTSTSSCFAINKSYNGCVRHHIDKNTIIHIPESLHQLVRHNLKTGKGMKEMNENAFRWLRQQSHI